LEETATTHTNTYETNPSHVFNIWYYKCNEL